MNNSRLAIEKVSLYSEETVDRTPELREQEAELLTVLNALTTVISSQEWGTLKMKLFDTVLENLTKDLLEESKKEIPDTGKLNRLTGQILWAEKYVDLQKLGEGLRLQLTQIRKILYGTS